MSELPSLMILPIIKRYVVLLFHYAYHHQKLLRPCNPCHQGPGLLQRDRSTRVPVILEWSPETAEVKTESIGRLL